MSARLFNLLVSTLRQNLPRYPLIKPAVHARTTVTAMDVITETVDERNPDLVKDKGFTRYKKRFMKRQWEDTVRDKTENGEPDEKKACDKPFERIKRKKMAMLLGYSGVDYYGMQRNPGVPTIEEDLLKALRDAKYITEEDFLNQQNAQFQRSSRTDKGVSAARQVVSLKLPLEINIEEINKRLPECIRVFGVKRVTNKFNSKSKCNARTYSYTLPTYTFEASADDEEKRKAYRITPEKIEKVNEVLAFYKGTKSYHNFTEKKHFQDPSACRYMMGFTLDRVFVASDMEFAVLLVKGQSFMLHQIRKMIGLTVAIVRGHTDISIMNKVFGKDKVMIPTIPGLGLVLDKVHYERYDAKFKDSHESLTWTEADEVIEKFKHEHIYPNIVKGEIEGNSMGLWLEKLNKHSYEPSEDIPEDKDAKMEGDDDDDDDAGIDDDEDNEKGSDEQIKENVEILMNIEVNEGEKLQASEGVSKIEENSAVVNGKIVDSDDKSVSNDDKSVSNDDKSVSSDQVNKASDMNNVIHDSLNKDSADVTDSGVSEVCEQTSERTETVVQ